MIVLISLARNALLRVELLHHPVIERKELYCSNGLSQITKKSWGYNFFALTTLKIFFFLKFWHLEEFKLLLHLPPGIFHWHPQQKGYNFLFLENHNIPTMFLPHLYRECFNRISFREINFLEFSKFCPFFAKVCLAKNLNWSFAKVYT